MVQAHPSRPFLMAWRKRQGMSKLALAKALGVAHTSVGRWEEGGGVDDKTFEAIARLYGITPAQLSAHPDEAERAALMGQLMERVQRLDADRLRLLLAALPPAEKK